MRRCLPESLGDLRVADSGAGLGDFRNLKSALDTEVTVGTKGLAEGDWNSDNLDLPATM